MGEAYTNCLVHAWVGKWLPSDSHGCSSSCVLARLVREKPVKSTWQGRHSKQPLGSKQFWKLI